MDDVNAELDRTVTSEVIRVVTEPTDWCSAMVPVVKKNRTVRICVDLKKLNIAVRRKHLMLPSLDDIAAKSCPLKGVLDLGTKMQPVDFVSMGSLNRHVRHVHKRLVKFRCQICGKGYDDRRNYHDHMATHAGVKQNVCTICQAQFTFKRALKAHVMRFHPDAIGSLNQNS